MSAYSIATRGLAGRKVPQGVLTPMGALLFAASEPGAWYDPSDMSTLFQDSAGTTPVTAVEQPVGRMLDLSGRGNHASMATTTKRPVYSRRVNLLTESEFRNGVTDSPIRGGAISASTMAGYLGAIAVGAEDDNYVYKIVQGLGNTQVVFSAVVQMEDSSAPRVSPYSGPSNDFLFIVEGVGYTPAQQEVAPGIYRLSVTTTIVSGGVVYFGAFKQSLDSTKTFKVTAYDLRLAADAHLPYQRVNTSVDYDADPAKFPAYLRFDGVDDALQTGNIDFTGTDKMTVWAGVTKLSDAGRASILELSASATNLIRIEAPSYAGSPNYFFGSVGSAQGSVSATSFPAPNTSTLTGVGNISGDTAVLRVNGVQVGASASDQGTGNYSIAPLYIGARAGTSLYFNGRLHGLIVRGAQSSLSQIEAAERYIKQKMRLP